MTLPVADTQFVEATGVWIVKSLVIFGFIFAVVPLLTLFERKMIGRFQNRYGPNRVGPFGLLQPLADVIKLISKEQSHPRTAAPLLMALAPAISILTAVCFGLGPAFGGTQVSLASTLREGGRSGSVGASWQAA